VTGDELGFTTIAEMSKAMGSGELSAVELVEGLLARIAALDQRGPALRSVIELNPNALEIAAALDEERRRQGTRGLLHGIPVLLKDNIDTGDKMLTTAGSLALTTSTAAGDATVTARLREAGAIILGKCNLSEWANFRSNRSVSGWSARGGQTLNPYRLTHNPCGSSSGSAVAVAAGFAPVALGTETDGSIVCPAGVNGVVGIKPTVGLTSRAGVVPISHTQDTVGPFARSVADAALVLSALVGEDDRDPATAASAGRYHRDYSRFLDPDGLRGARIGVPRDGFFGYDERVDKLIEDALQLMREAGAEIIDQADLLSAEAMRGSRAEMTVLLYEFKHDIAAYLETRLPLPGAGAVPRTLADLIAFNQANADREMPFFGQELFEQAEAMGPISDPAYKAALVESRLLSQEQGIDAVIAAHRLDALVAPTGGPAWPIDYEAGDPHGGSSSGPAAMAGYPLISVPAGFVDGLPVGITFMGPAYSEPTLIRLAYPYELRRGPFASPVW